MLKLDTLKGHNVQVGDKVQFHALGSGGPTSEVRTITKIDEDEYYATFGQDKFISCHPSGLWEVVERKLIDGATLSASAISYSKPDGGPAEYYDLPFKDWTTVNDMVEFLSDKQWGKHSWIFKDILKACTRFGKKSGTDESYDAKKIIYYGARLLMSVTDKVTLRKYLLQLLNDKQFQE